MCVCISRSQTKFLFLFAAWLVVSAGFLALGSCSPNELGATCDSTYVLQNQLETLQTPPGVDPGLFSQLKDRLMRELAGQSRKALVAPAGEANAPASPGFIDAGGGNYQLVWSYRNTGDYDQSGTVGITDITPLAMHFGHNGADGIDGIIDVDGNGVGISDVTPIAQNFGTNCDYFEIQWSTAETGPDWTALVAVPLTTGTDKDNGWMRFSHTAAFDYANWYRIVPFDAEGNPGQPSTAIQTSLTGQPPVILSAGPGTGLEGENITFTVDVDGTVDSYLWNFGGGAMPNTSSEPNPTVTLGAAGPYTVEITVANSFGSDNYTLELLVIAGGSPPYIDFVTPSFGEAGRQVQFSAIIVGDVTAYAWDFGSAATPSTSSDASPTVTLGAVGIYSEPSLTVTNDFGDSTLYFSVEVIPAWNRHYIAEGINVGAMSSADMTDGGPAVAFIDESDYFIYYAHPLTALPAQSSDWSVSVAANDKAYAACSFAWVNHLPRISGNAMTGGDFFYIFSQMSEPASPADWHTCKINSSYTYSYGDIVSCFSYPGVSYYTGDLIFARPTTQLPEAETDWKNTVVQSTGNTGFNSRIFYFDGKIIITYRFAGESDDEFRLAWCERDLAGTPSSWHTMTIDSGPVAGWWSDVAWDGDANILIAYTMDDANENSYLKLAYCGMEPEDTSDFGIITFAQEDDIDMGFGASVGFSLGKAYVVYGSPERDKMLLRTGDYYPGSLPEEWTTEFIDYGLSAVYGRTNLLVTVTDIIVIYHRNSGLAFATRPL